jgi:hypothetical protein
MPFIVATYLYASSQGQRTHSARTNSIAFYQVSGALGNVNTYSQTLCLQCDLKRAGKKCLLYLLTHLHNYQIIQLCTKLLEIITKTEAITQH